MNTKEDAATSLIGYLIALPIVGALFVWYNYVWIQWPVAYWQWVCLALPVTLSVKSFKPAQWAVGLVGSVAMVAQVAKWIGLVSLPLIRL